MRRPAAGADLAKKPWPDYMHVRAMIATAINVLASIWGDGVIYAYGNERHGPLPPGAAVRRHGGVRPPGPRRGGEGGMACAHLGQGHIVERTGTRTGRVARTRRQRLRSARLPGRPDRRLSFPEAGGRGGRKAETPIPAPPTRG